VRYNILPPTANKSQVKQHSTLTRKGNHKQKDVLENFRWQREEWSKGIATKKMLFDLKLQ
jgi:hypothetical protein